MTVFEKATFASSSSSSYCFSFLLYLTIITHKQASKQQQHFNALSGRQSSSFVMIAQRTIVAWKKIVESFVLSLLVLQQKFSLFIITQKVSRKALD